MTVYSQISANKTKTYFIFILFIFIVTGFFYLIGLYSGAGNSYLLLGFIFSLCSSFFSYFFSDKIVLYSVGAVEADKNVFYDLYTVTENLAIASGLPKPKVYVIEDPSPNAFATGRDPKHAIVCVTTGLLATLNRSELEGVVGHELSHVKNYDILLASVISVLVGSVALISDWVMRSMWWGGLRRSNDEDRQQSPLVFFFVIIAIIIIPITATLIQLAISRKREFLADAGSVLLTRRTEGLIRALEKISSSNIQLQTASTATAHLFISNPFRKNQGSSWFTNLFSTHPPIEERIKILKSM